MPGDLDSLIARLEAAAHGSFDLDREIWEYVAGDDASKLDLPPAYSVSLAPEIAGDGDGYWEVSGPRRYLNIPSPVPNYWRAEFTFGKPFKFQTVVGWGATEALARRIASLKARASLKTETDGER